MKRHIRDIFKGFAYILLYVVGQEIAVFFLSFYFSFQSAMENPDAMSTEAGMMQMMEDVTARILEAQGPLLMIAFLITMLVLTVFFRARGKRLREEVWAMPVRITMLWPVVLLGASLALVTCYLISVIPWPEEMLATYETLYANTVDTSVLTFFVTVLFAPILEEVIFRGLAFTRFCRVMPPMAALLLSAVIFGAFHGALIWMIYAIIGGAAMTLVYMKYRSLYASILMHMVFNVVGGYLVTLIVTPSAAVDLLILGAAAAVLAGVSLYLLRVPYEKLAPKKKGEIVE
ncbi:MAG: CPBP family intramembrane metalloprotease [Ruminococcaceae bacterium]|nr:CPBP family intramembrane metalloprotease [Oscillospiraceae bacterium]